MPGGKIRVMLAGDLDCRVSRAMEKCGAPPDFFDIVRAGDPSEAESIAGASWPDLTFAALAVDEFANLAKKLAPSPVYLVAKKECLSVDGMLDILKAGAAGIILDDDTLEDEVRAAVRGLATGRAATPSTEFFTHAIHELKTPLAVVRNYLGGVEKNPSSPKSVESLRRAEARLAGMSELVRNLAETIRIRSTPRKNIRPVDITALAARLLEEFKEAAAMRRVELRLSTAQEVAVDADERDVESLLANLISNAIKYNVDSGKVEVGAVIEPDGTAAITVSDTGAGIANEDQKRLFEMFSRIKNASTRGVEGSGLGLSIVKSICEAYGGRVEVESRPGSGSVFTARIRPMKK